MRTLTLFLTLVLLGSTPVRAEQINGFDVSDALIPRSEIMSGGPPRDGIPALTDPAFESAAAAGLAPDDRVLGLARNGIAKAYPLSIMTWHEIVNDRFDAEPVVVTYCPLCFTGMAFGAALDGRRHDFGVSGLLYNSDVLMYDRQTESLWSQLRREAISGPHKGRRLEQLPMLNTSWADWLARHPDTLVLSRDTGHRRDYGQNPYAGYEASPQVMFPVRFRAEGYHPKERVLGVTLAGKSRAWPFMELARGEATFADRLGDQELVVHFDPVHASAEVRTAQGEALPSTIAYWFAWYAFHPDTEVYRHAAPSAASQPERPAR